jgi:CDP-diacylglycerol--glycerol-3-phosphate 3-phosphatidyltransferase
MRVPGFITPNTLTVARIALIPFGVYVLFLDGGDNPKYQALARFFSFLDLQIFSMGVGLANRIALRPLEHF